MSDATSQVSFCDAVVNVDMAAGAEPADVISVPSAEVASAVDAYSNTLRTLLPAVRTSAPPQIAPAVTTLERLNLDAASRGDAAVYRRPDFLAAAREIDAYALATCGFQDVEIRTRNFAYADLPERPLAAGVVAFSLTNGDAGSHALVISRIADTEARPLRHLVGLSSGELQSVLSPIGAVRVDAGQSATTFLRMPAGRYAVLCTVPTPSASAPTSSRPVSSRTTLPPPPPGPPHYAKGEFGEVVVG